MSITITIFATLLAILVACNALITQAIKVAFDKREKKYSSNLIALITSIAIGGFGSVIADIFLGITFNISSIICILLFMIAIWIGSMMGYDKVFQLIEQIKNMKF